MSASETTRRSILLATAAVGADLLPYARKVDAREALGPIEAAYPNHVRLMDEWDAACAETWRFEELYEEPDRPGWHPATCEGRHKLVPVGEKKCRVYLSDDPENLERLREIIETPAVPNEHEQLVGCRVRRAARATAELEAILAWQAECKRRSDAVGLTAAREAETSARDAAKAATAAMFAIEAASFRELAFQAAHLREDWDDQRASDVIQRLTELASVPVREF